MTNITGFTNSKCTMGAFQNLEMLRQPAQSPWLDNMRLLTFIPEPYSLPKKTKKTVRRFNTIIGKTYVHPQFNMPKEATQLANQLFKISKLLQFVSMTKNQRNLRTYQRIVAEPNTQMALKMNARAINEVSNGRAVPFYAGYFDALKKPEPKVEQEAEQAAASKAKIISISDSIPKTSLTGTNEVLQDKLAAKKPGVFKRLGIKAYAIAKLELLFLKIL